MRMDILYWHFEIRKWHKTLVTNIVAFLHTVRLICPVKNQLTH